MPTYPERLLKLFRDADHGGDLHGAIHFGHAGQPGGAPWIQLRVRAPDGVVEATRWRTFGCPAAIGCGEAVCVQTAGQGLARLPAIPAAEVTEWVGGVPAREGALPGTGGHGATRARPRSWRVQVAHAGGDTWTYSLGCAWLL